jgi:hypothetical protein
LYVLGALALRLPPPAPTMICDARGERIGGSYRSKFGRNTTYGSVLLSGLAMTASFVRALHSGSPPTPLRAATERRPAGGRWRSGSSRASRCARDALEVRQFLVSVDLVSSVSSWTRGRSHAYRGRNIKNARDTIVYIRSK